MNDEEILEKIIAEEGSCDWVLEQPTSICESCPMSKFRLKDDGTTYWSCLQAIGADLLTTKLEVDAKYKSTAEQILTDLSFEKKVLNAE